MLGQDGDNRRTGNTRELTGSRWSPDADGANVPWTIPRVLATGGALGAIALVVWLLFSVRDVLLLAMLAILFAVLVDACVQLLRRGIGMPRWAALAAVVFLAVAALVAGALLLSPLISEDVSRLSERIPSSLDDLERQILRTYWGGWVSDRLERLEKSTSLGEASRRFFGFFSSALGAASSLLLVVVLGLFLAAEPATYVGGSLKLLPPKGRLRGEQVARELGHALRWWLLGRLASALIVFALTLSGLVFLQVPLPFLLALIAGVFSFVPTFGPIVAAAPALLVALSLGLDAVLWVALLYLGVQAVESYSITPFIERRAVRLAPALVISFQVVMGVLAGALGIILATPILVTMAVLAGMLYVEDGLNEETSLP